MIQARLAAPRRAALVTAMVLTAAVMRALLLPLGDLLSTLVFAGCLMAITISQSSLAVRPHKGEGSPRRLGDHDGGAVVGTVAGLALGFLLLLPVVANPLSGRPLGAFWSWALIAAVVATLEETAIRGALYRRWLDEAGPLAAIGIGAVVFALIHLPRYGFAAMPLDFAVGLALGGLRAVTGRVFPCAIAHTIADWGAWFWA